MTLRMEKKDLTSNPKRNLSEAKISEEYIIKDVISVDKELKDFLFTLFLQSLDHITFLTGEQGHACSVAWISIPRPRAPLAVSTTRDATFP